MGSRIRKRLSVFIGLASNSANAAASTYTYEPLVGERTIRLVQATRIKNRTQLQFKNVSLDDLPSYTALSYAWGSDKRVDSIQCGSGGVLAITRSVKEILEEFTAKGPSSLLWIDFLCINQDDIQEKGRQIRLMRDVYKQAAKVTIWLGTGSGETKTAILMLWSMAESFKARGMQVTLQQAGNAGGYDWPSKQWTGVYRLLSRAWFKRMWVVQEAVLGEKVQIRCGDETLAWKDLATVVTCIRINPSLLPLFTSDHKSPGTKTESLDAIHLVSSVEGLRALRMKDTKVGIQDALAQCCQFGTTKAHDKIYGLLGLVADGDAEVFDPNYEQSVQVLYTNVMKHMLTSGNTFSLLAKNKSSLDVLHQAGTGYQRALADLPSWVPDWSAIPNVTCYGNIAPLADFRASGDKQAIIELTDASSVIRLQVILLDEVTETTPPMPVAGESSNEEHQRTLSAFIRTSKDLAERKARQPEHTSAPEILWRTLCVDRAQNYFQPAVPQFGECFDAFVKLVDVSQGLYKIDEIAQDEITKAGIFQGMMQKAVGKRSVFATTKGYLGLGWPSVKAGDRVCLIMGATTPFIVRPLESPDVHGSSYALVGECSVYGLMRGEGLSQGSARMIQIH